MSHENPTLTDVVAVLSQSYKDHGVMIWLTAKNRQLPSKPDGNWTCSPMEYIAAGHIGEVYEAACRIDGLTADDLPGLRAVEALFSGGPDTSCRTVWDDGIECVSVPLADLRAVLDGHYGNPR